MQAWNTKAAAAALLLGLAAALRIAAALGDFYNDEIWSLEFAGLIDAPWEALTRVHHDNNHILNTLLVYWIGTDAHWLWYRVLSLVTGTASVGLLGYASSRRGAAEALTTLYLAGLSYPLILYSSEARGYAPAIFFAVSAFLLVQSRWARRKPWKLGLLWLSILLGLLSHLTSSFVFVSLLLWAGVRELRAGPTPRASVLELMKCFAVPALLAASLYVIDVRHMATGGGEDYGIGEVVRRGLLLAVGAPSAPLPEALCVAAVALAAAWGLYCLRDDPNQPAIFFLCVLLIVPGAVLVLRQPEYIYFRYLIVCVPFLYLLLSSCLVSILRTGRGGRIAASALLLLFAAGNAPPIISLISLGRGQYREAVLYMAHHTPGPNVLVGSDHDFRNQLVLRYYARFLPENKTLLYVEQDEWPAEGVHWALTHSQDLAHTAPRRLVDRGGNAYLLEKTFPYSGISGWNWYLYRRAAPRSSSAPEWDFLAAGRVAGAHASPHPGPFCSGDLRS